MLWFCGISAEVAEVARGVTNLLLAKSIWPHKNRQKQCCTAEGGQEWRKSGVDLVVISILALSPRNHSPSAFQPKRPCLFLKEL